MKRLITNNTNQPMYVGDKLLPPGMSAEVDETSSTSASAEGAPSSGSDFDPEAFVKLSAKDVIAKLSELTMRQLQVLQHAEQQQDKPRSSVLDAIGAELLQKTGQ